MNYAQFIDPHYDVNVNVNVSTEMVFKLEFIKFPFQSEIYKFSLLPGFEPGTSLLACRCANH